MIRLNRFLRPACRAFFISGSLWNQKQDPLSRRHR